MSFYLHEKKIVVTQIYKFTNVIKKANQAHIIFKLADCQSKLAGFQPKKTMCHNYFKI